MREKMKKVIDYVQEHDKAFKFIFGVCYSVIILVWYYRFMKNLLVEGQDTDTDDIISEIKDSSKSWDEPLE